MSGKTPAALAELLVHARREGHAVSAAGWETVLQNAEQAYAVQDAVASALGWFADGPPRHWKSGGPSRRATLTHAPLAPAGVKASPADFSDLRLHHGGIEAEIALRLGEDVTPDVAARLTPDDATSLVEAITVSIEIVDSRWLEGSQAPALLRLADAQSHGALALGAWVPFAPRDWSTQRCETRIGTQEAVVRTGTLSVGEPTWLLPLWLRHATRHGATVPMSTIVTTGTWVGLLPATRGDPVSVEFAGIGRTTLRL
jgi:2-keto-4-pentenoate hydratase